ncbi:hypothetical protein AVEN_110573-1 [Araneus ventricosus]|uniref:Uncharacterized protein n=1 Tax=Araneus ventricosus TaxID=182803 RepID=A0A4Y2J366_ARAVE|nr:hypothetical protein AVEN_2464-1 [Araneus ventricosus]GBM84350.1 hypothetical protein AVEN_249108-1 [Araneus ventricosus]GBM84393.1 hypothetical protein AVEN_82582-1 [Araneus ventricosus]GBM84400.1 hypothetical protein AVEN_110573-1 [Araneus ventricosus]
MSMKTSPSLRNTNKILKLIFRSEATLDGSSNLKPHSDGEDDICVGIPSPIVHSTIAGGNLVHDVIFNGHQIDIYGGSSVEPGFEADTLSLSHSGLSYIFPIM